MSQDDENDSRAALRARLLGDARQLPTSALTRLWKSGRSAAGLAASALGQRLRGGDAGLAQVDLRAVRLLVERLGELKGLSMKAGQILGYIDPTLPSELRALLSLLQTTAQPTPFAAVEATLRDALGERSGELLEHLQPAPVAVASIGQVHRARLGGVEVAVKVRHPGIEAAFLGDFRTANVGPLVSAIVMPGVGANVREYVEEARTAMLEECDFELEGRHQARFGEIFAGDPNILIPGVWNDWTCKAVLVSDWKPGRSFDALLASSPAQQVRDALGVALFRFYIGTLYQYGVFHADPHPGNYAFPEQGGLVVYDFGCVRTFDRPTVAGFARLLAALRGDHADELGAALLALGAHSPRAELSDARELLRGFFAPMLVPGARAIEAGAALASKQLLQDKRRLARLGLPGKFLFLFRLRFGLYAVLARLGAVADWAALEMEWAERTRVAAAPPGESSRQ